MQDQDELFELPADSPRPGRVRRGLETDVRTARGAGHTLTAAGIASLRSLADQLDSLERFLRRPGVRPYDRVPLAQLQHQFDETYDRVFDAADVDPLEQALADFRAAEARDPAHPPASD